MQENAYPSVASGPPQPNRIVRPWEFTFNPAAERLTVHGAGAILIHILAGDDITITNDEGGQPCEVVAADTTGRIDAGVLGLTANADVGGLKTLLITGDGSLRRLRKGLEVRGIDLSAAGGLRFFDTTTPAKDKIELSVKRGGWLVVAAPGENMTPDGRNTATSLTLIVKRSQVVRCKAGHGKTTLLRTTLGLSPRHCRHIMLDGRITSR